MSAPPCPELAAELYEQVLASTDSVGGIGDDMLYLIGAILTGSWVNLDVEIGTETITFLRTLPSKDAFLMYCTSTKYTLDQVTAARVAVKLLS